MSMINTISCILTSLLTMAVASGMTSQDARVAVKFQARLDQERAGDSSEPPALQSVTVKILVDEEEPASRRAWEERIRKRLQGASEVVQRDFQIKFEAVAVGTWGSDDSIADFRSL